MGCILSIIGMVISNLLYFAQKFFYCFTCAALVSCIVTTIFIVLGMGIGIGYNYCFVDFKTRHRLVRYRQTSHHYKPTPKLRWPDHPLYRTFRVTDSVQDLRTADSSVLTPTRIENETKSHNNTNNIKRSHNNINYETTEHMHENKDLVTETNKQTSTETTIDDSPNMIIPISGLDLIALLSKFRSENRNYSLQIVTT